MFCSGRRALAVQNSNYSPHSNLAGKMVRGLTHFISVKGLNSLSYIAVGCCMQCFFVRMTLFELASMQATFFLTSERLSRTRH